MTTFVRLRPKMNNYLKDDGNDDKIAKGTNKCVIKWELKFEDYKNCLEANRLENNIKYLKTIKLK